VKWGVVYIHLVSLLVGKFFLSFFFFFFLTLAVVVVVVVCVCVFFFQLAHLRNRSPGCPP
jgi:hypothetical protein